MLGAWVLCGWVSGTRGIEAERLFLKDLQIIYKSSEACGGYRAADARNGSVIDALLRQGMKDRLDIRLERLEKERIRLEARVRMTCQVERRHGAVSRAEAALMKGRPRGGGPRLELRCASLFGDPAARCARTQTNGHKVA
jgi:hypothetical protein